MPLALAMSNLPSAGHDADLGAAARSLDIGSRYIGSLAERAAEAKAARAIDDDFSRTLAAFGGVAARARIHALHPARPGDEGAATGFALAVLGHLAALSSRARGGTRQLRPILWVQDRGARQEAGLPYGLGFASLGLELKQFIIVSTKTALDALAAAEIGLEIGGLDGVLAELPRNLPADMLALGKRLALRAERSAVPCLLLHATAAAVPAPVATRWQIASRGSVPDEAWGASLPAVDLALCKNRFGPIGQWPALLKPARLSVNSVFGHPESSGASDVSVAGFIPQFTTQLVPGFSAPLSEPLAAVPADRSRAPPARAFAA